MDIAIVVVAYNRVDSLSRLLKSLLNASYLDTPVSLIISVDHSDTSEVEDFADAFKWPFGKKQVVKYATNLGLRKHILSIGNFLDQFDAIIVLEDDLEVSPAFFCYAKQTVAKYYKDTNIAGISLYGYHLNYQTCDPFIPYRDQYDVYFINCAMSWGQIWMKHQWKEFKHWYDDHQDFTQSDDVPAVLMNWPKSSWLKYHIRYCIENNKSFVMPYVSYTTNNADLGTHVSAHDSAYLWQVPLQEAPIMQLRLPEYGVDGVYYDGFYENKVLYKHLGLTEGNCCLDLNMSHSDKNKQYWLTTRRENYKIIRSYGVRYRPIECNVLKDCPGAGIFLYDTTRCEKHTSRWQTRRVLLYRFNIGSIYAVLRKYGFGYCIMDICASIFHIIKNHVEKYYKKHLL